MRRVWIHEAILSLTEIEVDRAIQQDYYVPQYSTLLHTYCTCTYTELTALLLWSISVIGGIAVTM